jgi:hypothetical protein
MGIVMKKTMLTVATLLAMGAGAAQAADLRMAVKAPPPVYVSPWDIAFGGSVASDYLPRYHAVEPQAGRRDVHRAPLQH